MDGSVHVIGPEPDLLRMGAVVLVNDRAARIERRAGTDARPIVRLEGCTSRSDAEALRGAVLRARVQDAPPLADGEYWAHDLAGCAVVDGERPVGVVARMRALPSCEVLEVSRPDGDELLVPLVQDAIRSIDVEARRIDIVLAFLGEP